MRDLDLKFIQRVLESDAPKADREKAAQMVRDARRARPASGASDADTGCTAEVTVYSPADPTPAPALAASEARVKELREALEELKQAAVMVAQYGAQRGSQWTRLNVAIVRARAVLTKEG